MKLKTYRDDDCEKSWISAAPMTDSDWPVWFILRLEYMEQHMSDAELKEFGGRYHASILAVAPSAVSAENMQRAFDCIGQPLSDDPAMQIEALVNCGIYATLHQQTGNNLSKLEREARKQLPFIGGILFGFKMDSAQNRIGNSGWDFIKGEIGFKAGV